MTTDSFLSDALLDPHAYPHPVDRVDLVETHISWVFLAGDRVYKVKKPVNLGFLDFSTLAQRRRACADEVRLNRRLTSGVYVGVVPLTRGPAGLRVGGRGRTVEVAVAMRRLPADRMLDRLVAGGAASPTLLRTIARLVARFHNDAATGGEVDVLGGFDAVRRNWDENFAQVDAWREGDLLPDEDRRILPGYVTSFLEREVSRFAARVTAGRSRDGHGDLQAQHVCCTDPIQIFDCIEFNHRFRFGDTAGEIAFLAVDLERLGRPDLALAFLDAYLEESGDWEAIPLLDFYRAYRAFVRGKVLGLQAAEHPERAPEARTFFRQAVGYVNPARSRRLAITCGVMGSGKTTVGRALATRIGAFVIRTDAVRKHLAGVDLRARSGHAFGEGPYSRAMGERTYTEALRLAAEALAAGWPIVIDGSFATTAERQAARALARRADAPFTVLWCDAPDSVLATRLRARAVDPDEVSDGRETLLVQHRAAFQPPAGEADVVRLDTTQDLSVQLELV